MNTDLATLRALYVTTRNERAMGAQIDTRHVFGMLEGAPADVLAAFAPKPSDVTVTAADVAAHSYANGDFDLAQSVAQRLTDAPAQQGAGRNVGIRIQAQVRPFQAGLVEAMALDPARHIHAFTKHRQDQRVMWVL